jgi:hypothetical protein
VVTILDNVPIEIIEAQLTAQGSFRSPSRKGNGTILLSREAETLPTSQPAAKLASLRKRLQHFTQSLVFYRW